MRKEDNNTARKKTIILLSLLVGIIYFIIGIFTVYDYGINWDEPGHYIRAQAFLRYFLTGKKDYKGVPKLKFHYPKNIFTKLPLDITYDDDRVFRRSIYQYDSGTSYLSYSYWATTLDVGHPSINGELAALSNNIFYQKLGIMGDIESYHLFTIFVSSLLVAVVFLFAASEYGLFAGFIAALSLSLYPLFFAESHFNIKDPVEASFYSLTLFTFYKAVIKKNWKIMLISSIFAGLALGTKFNILFASITILFWLIIYKWKSIKALKWPFSRSLTLSLLLYPIVAAGLVFAFWPNLWIGMSHIITGIKYYKDIGYGIIYQPQSFLIRGGFNTYPLLWVIFTTPLIILFLSLFGIVYILRYGNKESHKSSLFILFWFIVPILRVTIPNTGIYGGTRQIMEYVPAMAILSGIGAKYIVTLLNCYIVKHRLFNKVSIKSLFILQIFMIIMFLPITFKLISLHPNENVYFNPLIGGLKGAKERNFPDWGVTLGSAYNQGMDWLNLHAERDANVALVKGLLSDIPRIKIRQDINFSENYYSGPNKKGEYLMELIDYYWQDVPLEKRTYIETLEPIYELKEEGVTILAIWKNDVQHTKPRNAVRKGFDGK